MVFVLASSACGGESPTKPSAVTLSGTWAGTAGAYAVVVRMEHAGTKLTGSLTTPPNYGVFDLTETASTGAMRTFTGTFLINPDGTERCKQVGRPGTMTVDTAAGTMTGAFTGTNFDCATETNKFDLKKQ